MVEPVRQPHDLRAAILGQGTLFHRLERRHPVGRPGARLQGLGEFLGLAWGKDMDPLRAGAGRRGSGGDDGDRTAVARRLIGQFHQQALTGRPTLGRGPAVVDAQDERTRALPLGGLIDQRTGGGQDQKGRDGKAQDNQPGRRLGRAFFPRDQSQQQTKRREGDPRRRRRGQAQQPPDDGQGQQAEQRPGGHECEGAEGKHGVSRLPA